MAPHTRFTKHKRLLVILKDGTRYVDVYLGKTEDDRCVKLSEHGEVPIKKIRALGVYKPVA